jgi:creatinine amidohydrolase
MLWHEQSFPAIAALDKDMPVVIPIAACEQHGEHLPVFVDTIQVTEIANRVEAEMRDQILLTPALWLGCSHHHIDFPGTISVLPSLYTNIIKSITKSILHAGFKRIFFLNGHGGNVVPGSQALTELVDEDDEADDAYLALSSWWSIGADKIVGDAVGAKTPNLSHACEYETSVMLFARPDLVDMDKIKPRDALLQSDWFYSERMDNKVSVFKRFHRLTETGHMGKPELATAEIGEAIVDISVRETKAFLAEFATWPPLKATRGSMAGGTG